MAVRTQNIEAQLNAPGIDVQVIRAKWSQTSAFEAHTRQYAISLVLSPLIGSQVCLGDTRGNRPFCTAGALTFTPADADVRVKTSGGTIRHVVCSFDKDLFEDLAGIGHNRPADLASRFANIRSNRLTEILTWLAREAIAPGSASARLTEHLGSVTAIELARHFEAAAAKAETSDQTLSPWQIRRVTDYVEGMSGRSADISHMADLCGISERHLRRLFKQATGQTISEYVRSAWLSKARALLSETGLPLKTISWRLGFSDPNSFSTAFRKATGEAPKMFRQHFQRPQ